MTKGVKAALIQYFDENPNKRVHVTKLAQDLGFNEETVRTGINNLRASEPDPYREQLQTVVRGKIWIFKSSTNGEKPDNQKLFALIGGNADGILILQDSDGDFYKAQKLS